MRATARRSNPATANRLANFDDANLRRSARAAVAAGARVDRAMEILGEDVPDHLRMAGQLRLEHKQASDHPWFIGVQFHPELKSRPFEPHPLFAGFIEAAVKQSRLV